jgi:hypothetical protein
MFPQKYVPLWTISNRMPEILLHYIWQKHLWAGFSQTTTDGQSIEIISVGQHNIHAGADFSHAHICINGQDWIGNIEIHVQASDWYKHNHHTNPAYDSTILHVVAHADKEVLNSRGEPIPQCELQYPHDKDYLSLLFQQANPNDIPCGKQLIKEPTLLTKGWKHTLLKKRLDNKCQYINQLLHITQQSWIHAFYITLAHNFGFHTNGIPFELLAIQTPLSYLQKHRNSLFQITAILLGQSGLLDANSVDPEKRALWQEYIFLQKKFSLHPIDGSLWKKARMRPQGAPEVRIRQFAHLIYQSEHLFADLMEAQTIEDMVDLLTLKYDHEEVYACVERPLPLGRKSIEILLINTVIPYRYAYTHSQSPIDMTIYWLENIKKEDNTIIRQWTMIGQIVNSAADTQALIHLYQNYCQPHLCFHCQIGHQIFSQKELVH